MMKIGRASVTAATPLILRGFLLPQARDAAARRLSRKFKDPIAKTRYTYVYRSECAASPKELPGFGFPPSMTGTRLGAAGDDSSHRRGRRRPRCHKSAAANQRLSFCLELPHPDPAGSAPILPLIPITLWQSRVDIKAVEFADPFPAPLS